MRGKIRNKKIMKGLLKLFVFLICISALLTSNLLSILYKDNSLNISYAEDLDSGTVGTLEWTYMYAPNEYKYYLYIGGNGAIPDFENAESTPWYKYRDTIDRINLLGSANITGIGDYAFAGLYKATNFTSSYATLTGSIGKHAFDGCGLISAGVASGITSIEDYAYANCPNLNNFKFPESQLTTVGEGIFTGCDDLSIVLPATSAYTEEKLGCKIIRWSEDGDVLTFTGEGKITNYSQSNRPWSNTIKTVVLDDRITRIGENAFIDIPVESINFPSTLEFGEGCLVRTNIGSINITGSEIIIDKQAFLGSNNITDITITADRIVLNPYALYNIPNLKTVTLNSDDITIATYSFYGNTNLQTISLSSNPKYIDFNREIINGIPEYAFYNCQNLQHITGIDWNAVHSIGNYAFYNCYALCDTVKLNNVSSIGNFSFMNCYKLNLNVDSNIATEVGQQAFNNCYGLRRLKSANLSFTYYVLSNKANGSNAAKNIELIDFGSATSIPNSYNWLPIQLYNNKTSYAAGVTFPSTGVFYVKKALSDATASIDENSFDYSGEAVKPVPTVTVDLVGYNSETLTVPLIEGEDYIVTYDDDVVNAGSKNVHITGIDTSNCGDGGGYAGTVDLPYTINAIDLSSAVIGDIPAQSWTGTDVTPKPTVTLGEKALVEGTDFYFSYSSNVGIGTNIATVTINGMGNYKESVSKNFTILKDVNNLNVSEIGDVSYDGNEQTPTITVKDGDTELTNGEQYTVSYSNNINAGTGIVTITGQGLYTGTKNVNFTIQQKEIKFEIENAAFNKEYDGSETKIVTAQYQEGLVAGDDVTTSYQVTCTYASKNVGTYQEGAEKVLTVPLPVLTGDDAENYLPCYVSTYQGTISPKTIALDLSEEPAATKVYDNSNKALWSGNDYKTLSKPGVNGETLNLTVTGTYIGNDPTGVGIGNKKVMYSLKEFTSVNEGATVVGTDNYNLLIDNTKNTTSNNSITKRTITESDFEQIDNSNVIYDGSLIYKTITPKSVIDTSDYLVDTTNNKNAGTATITITGFGNNCDGEFKVYFDIEAVEITESMITITQDSIIYDGSAKEPSFKVEYNGNELKKNDDYIYGYQNNTNVTDSAELFVTGIGNYKGTKITKTFNIEPRSLLDTNISVIINPLKWTGSDLSGNESVEVFYKFKKLSEGTDYSYTLDSDTTSRGARPVTITGLGNYTGTRNTDTLSIYDDDAPLLSGDVTIEGGNYSTGDKIDFTLTFNENVNMTGTNKFITLALNKNASDEYDGKFVSDLSGEYVHAINAELNTDILKSHDNILTFTYTVKDGDYVPDGFEGKVTALTGTILDESSPANEFAFPQEGLILKDKIEGTHAVIITPAATSSEVIEILDPSGSLTSEQKEEKINDILKDPSKMEKILDDTNLDPLVEEDKKIIDAISNIEEKLANDSDDSLKEYVAEILAQKNAEESTPEEQRKWLINEINEVIETKELIDNISDTSTDLNPNKFIDAYEEYKNMSDEQKQIIDEADGGNVLEKLIEGYVNETIENIKTPIGTETPQQKEELFDENKNLIKNILNDEKTLNELISNISDDNIPLIKELIVDNNNQTKKDEIIEWTSEYIKDKEITGSDSEEKKEKFAELIEEALEAFKFKEKLEEGTSDYTTLYKEYSNLSNNQKDALDDDAIGLLKDNFEKEAANKLDDDSNLTNESKDDLIETLINDKEIMDDLIDNSTALTDEEKQKVRNNIINESDPDKKDEIIEFVQRFIEANPIESKQTDDKKIEELDELIYDAIVAKELEDLIRNEMANIETGTSLYNYDDLIQMYDKLTDKQTKAFDTNLLNILYDKYENWMNEQKVEVPSTKDGKKDSVSVHDFEESLDRPSDKSVVINIEEKATSKDLNDANKDLEKFENDNPGSLDYNESAVKVFDFEITEKDNQENKVEIKDGKTVTVEFELPDNYDGKKVNVYVVDDEGNIKKVADDVEMHKNNDGTSIGSFETDTTGKFIITSSDEDITTIEIKENDGKRGGEIIPTKNQDEWILTPDHESNNNEAKITVYVYDEDTNEYVEDDKITVDLSNGNQTYKLPSKYEDKKVYIEIEFDKKVSPPGGGGGSGGGGGGAAPAPVIVPIVEKVQTYNPEGSLHKAYIKGYEDGTFIGTNNLTRSEGAIIIARLISDFDENSDYRSGVDIYKDLTRNNWQSNYVGYVTQKGIMQGDSGLFRPKDNMTRGELAYVLYTVFKEQISTLPDINDKQFSDLKNWFYKDCCNTLLRKGLLNGYDDGTFKGQSYITRAEAVTMINNALGRNLASIDHIKSAGNTVTFKDVSENTWYYQAVLAASNTYSDENENALDGTTKNTK